MAMLFPLGLLVLAPVFDLVRALTNSPPWTTVAFWCCFVGVCLALVTYMPLVIDCIALDDKHERNTRLPMLILHGAGILAFVGSVVLRLHARGALSPSAFTCADAGLAVFALAALLATPRYQPTGLPFNSPSSHASSGLK